MALKGNISPPSAFLQLPGPQCPHLRNQEVEVGAWSRVPLMLTKMLWFEKQLGTALE